MGERAGHARALGALALVARRPAGSALAAVLAAGALARLAFPGGEADEVLLLAYEVVLCGIALSLVGASRRGALTDLVVELGERRSALRDALAAALGDPKLELGYWSEPDGAYVDGAGRRLESPPPGRARTLIEREGRPLAALIHDAAALDDLALVEAVTSAARLADTNARLQAEVRSQIAELAAARRRVIEAADEERRALELRLRDGAGRRIQRLAGTLAGLDGAPIGRASEVLERTREDLLALSAGLHPARAGLPAALAALARDSATPVALSVADERLDSGGRVGGLLRLRRGTRERHEVRLRHERRDHGPPRRDTAARGDRRRRRRRRRPGARGAGCVAWPTGSRHAAGGCEIREPAGRRHALVRRPCALARLSQKFVW